MKKTGLLLLGLLVFSAAGGFGQDIDELNKKGLEYVEHGDYTKAITVFSDGIKRYNDVDAYWYRGSSYIRIKNFDAAIADYDIVIQRSPDFAFAYMQRGYAYGEQGIYFLATKDYRQALEKGFDISLSIAYKSDKSAMWLCCAILMGIAENNFLGNSAAVIKNEAWLKTLCDKHGLSRAEIDNYFRDTMRAEVKAVVDEEFNKISFMLTRDYNAWLTYVPKTGQYILDYQGFMEDKQSITASNLTALASEMRKKSFDDAAINQVREQASQTPAAVYAQRHARGEADALELIIEAVTNFFVDPSQNNYNTLLGIDARYSSSYSSTQTKASLAYSTALNRIWDGFGRRIAQEVNKDGGSNIHTYARFPNDPRFAVFGGR